MNSIFKHSMKTQKIFHNYHLHVQAYGATNKWVCLPQMCERIVVDGCTCNNKNAHKTWRDAKRHRITKTENMIRILYELLVGPANFVLFNRQRMRSLKINQMVLINKEQKWKLAEVEISPLNPIYIRPRALTLSICSNS